MDKHQTSWLIRYPLGGANATRQKAHEGMLSFSESPQFLQLSESPLNCFNPEAPND